jgi:hypothetical protein
LSDPEPAPEPVAAPQPAFTELPPTAAWRCAGEREGFEVAWFDADPGGHRLRGHVTGLEAGETWSVAYEIHLDEAWCTRWARITQFSVDGGAVTELEGDGRGSWRVDGAPAPELDGCLDVDLEASGMTNTLPLHRLLLPLGAEADAQAAYVRLGPTVERLEQTYRRVESNGAPYRFEYAAPAFDFAAPLLIDPAGLVLDYPGIAARVL